MSGIDAVTMVNYYNMLGNTYGARALTPYTCAKLIALGVNIQGIRTEREGLIRLREAEAQRGNNAKVNKDRQTTKRDELTKEAKDLAKKLNISVADSDVLDDIIARIKNKINELKTQAGDDTEKLRNAQYYEGRLSDIQDAENTSLKLSSSMNLTANMNIAFHNLF